MAMSFFQKKNLNKIHAIFDVEKYSFEIISASVEKLLGYQPHEMLGGDYARFLIYQGDVEASEKAVEGNKTDGKGIMNFVNSYRHKNGEEVYLSWDASMIEGNECYCIATLATKEEIEKHKKIRHEKENKTQSIEIEK